MSKDEKIQHIAEQIKPVFQKYDIQYAGVFGSYARGEEKAMGDQSWDLIHRNF